MSHPPTHEPAQGETTEPTSPTGAGQGGQLAESSQHSTGSEVGGGEGAGSTPDEGAGSTPDEGAGSTPYRAGYGFLCGVAFVSLVADLVTKFWAEKALQTAQQVPTPKHLLKGTVGFGFVLARNRGGAWGLLQSADERIRKPFFVVVSLVAIVFIVSLYRRLHPSQRALRWGLPLVLGGALGNLVDRIRYGFVIDFIDTSLTWGGAPHHWPTFNVADIAICVGVGLMAVDMFSVHRRLGAEGGEGAGSGASVASVASPTSSDGAIAAAETGAVDGNAPSPQPTSHEAVGAAGQPGTPQG